MRTRSRATAQRRSAKRVSRKAVTRSTRGRSAQKVTARTTTRSTARTRTAPRRAAVHRATPKRTTPRAIQPRGGAMRASQARTIPGPGASDVGTTPYPGGSRSAGLLRDRGELRRPQESDLMNSAISGRTDILDEEVDKTSAVAHEQDESTRDNISNPDPNKPEPRGIPRAKDKNP